jgi:solute carrier family 15 (peptide/histidine transporter), member 3/4
MEVIEEKGPLEDYTQDGTVDLQGRPVLRSKTGRWKACSFLVGKFKYFTSLYRHS